MFQKIGFFASADARKRFVKALLTTNSFSKPCKFCGEHFNKLLQHQLNDCQNLKNEQLILELELNLYQEIGKQPIPMVDLHNVLRSVILNKCQLLCFTKFLQAVDY